MKISEGTKSLLFGSHSIIHSILVVIAWYKIYGKLPNWKEFVCIMIHDIGYFGMNHLSNKSNLGHARLGAKIAGYLFDYNLQETPWNRTKDWYNFVLGHSLSECKRSGIEPSKLEIVDDYSLVIMPMWFLRWCHMVENFEVSPEEWKEHVTKNFYSKDKMSGTELLNSIKEKNENK